MVGDGLLADAMCAQLRADMDVGIKQLELIRTYRIG
jgi:hypothetical protein